MLGVGGREKERLSLHFENRFELLLATSMSSKEVAKYTFLFSIKQTASSRLRWSPGIRSEESCEKEERQASASWGGGGEGEGGGEALVVVVVRHRVVDNLIRVEICVVVEVFL